MSRFATLFPVPWKDPAPKPSYQVLPKALLLTGALIVALGLGFLLFKGVTWRPLRLGDWGNLVLGVAGLMVLTPVILLTGFREKAGRTIFWAS